MRCIGLECRIELHVTVFPLAFRSFSFTLAVAQAGPPHEGRAGAAKSQVGTANLLLPCYQHLVFALPCALTTSYSNGTPAVYKHTTRPLALSLSRRRI